MKRGQQTIVGLLITIAVLLAANLMGWGVVSATAGVGNGVVGPTVVSGWVMDDTEVTV